MLLVISRAYLLLRYFGVGATAGFDLLVEIFNVGRERLVCFYAALESFDGFELLLVGLFEFFFFLVQLAQGLFQAIFDVFTLATS